MRKLVMALVAVGLFALLMLGAIGPVELIIWLVLVMAWILVLALWAIPGDRRTLSRPQNSTATNGPLPGGGEEARSAFVCPKSSPAFTFGVAFPGGQQASWRLRRPGHRQPPDNPVVVLVERDDDGYIHVPGQPTILDLAQSGLHGHPLTPPAVDAPATAQHQVLVDLELDDVEDLIKISDATGHNRVTTLSRAIRLLRLLTSAKHRGGQLTITYPDGKRERLLLQ